MISMGRYLIHAIITLKGVRDPEGETIHKDLVLSNGYTGIRKIVSGKYLGFEVEVPSKEDAIKYVMEVCEKARLYNPTVHRLEILGVENEGGSD